MRIEADVRKLYSDGQGKQTEAPLDLMLDVGVFGEELKDGQKTEKVLFLEKRRVQTGHVVFEVDVPGKPVRAGLDPFNKWVDRDSGDNVKTAEEGQFLSRDS